MNEASYTYYFLQSEELYYFLSNLDFYDPLEKGFAYFKQSLGYIANWSYYSFNPRVNFNDNDKEKLEALRKLSKNENIIITKPDKGTGVVLLDKVLYNEKMETILSDASKFSRVATDPFAHLLKHEDKVNRLLRKLKATNVISESEFNSLYCSGSRPGIMYGLPKVHKEGCPMRPILSAIGTHNYKLAKYLVPLLEPITMNQYTIKDSFSFAKELTHLDYRNCVAASFDIQSLFTNIPLVETIDICVKVLYQDDELLYGFNKKEMKDFLTITANDCMFLFNGKFYIQTDGCAMGSPIGPSFANIFLCYYEKIWLGECPLEFKPLFYRRYVDDTFLIFRDSNHIPLFLNYLNEKHASIQFTSETENDNTISFLDIDINNTPDGFQTSVYRKPTFTGLSTKFSSFIPLQYKRNLISTLAFRAFNLCSNYEGLHQELMFIKKFLFRNGFPLKFTETWIGKTLNKLIIPSEKEKLITVQRKPMILSMPFLGNHSLNIKKKLTKLLAEFYPQVSLRIVFSSSNSIQRYFKFKDTIPDNLRSSIIYLYKCDSCNASYVGKCERHFRTRCYEHEGRSVRTGALLAKPSHSAIRDHCQEKSHPMTKRNFSILGSTPDKLELIIMEALFQSRYKPNLGKTSFELSCI